MRLRTSVAALLTVLLLPAAAARAQAPPLPASGGLAELADPATCAFAPGALTDDEDAPATGCQTLAPLLGGHSVVTSADGRFVYLAGGTDAFTIFGHGGGYGGITVLSRDPATGALTRVQCLSSDASDGAGGPGCDPLTAGVDLVDLAISPDGTAVAAAGSGSGSLTLLARDPATGRLTEVVCAQEAVPYGGRCVGVPSLEGVNAVAFSPDGKDVYATSAHHSSVLQLRLADDGSLVRRCVSADGSSGSCARAPQLVEPTTLTPSPDGRFLYALTTLGVTWLARDTATGALTPGGCVVTATGAACGSGRTGSGGYSSTAGIGLRLAASPGRDTFLVGSGYYDDAAVTVLRRDEAGGGLTRVGCLAPTPYEEPEEEEEEPLEEEDPAAEEEEDDAATRQAPACAQAPVVPVGGAMTGLADGRFLVTGYGTAAVVTVAADGTPASPGCLAVDDNRCAPSRLAGSATAAAPLPGGGALLLGGALTQLAPAPQATARAAGRSVRIRLTCSGGGAAGCGGAVRVGRLGANLRSPAPAATGTTAATRFTLKAGARTTLTAPLPAAARRAAATITVRRGARTLRILAPVTGLRGVAAPARPRSCPAGALLAGAARGTRVVRTRAGAVVGCLRGERPVRLDRLGARAEGPVRIAGRFAAVVLRSAAGAGRAHRAVAVVDLRRGKVRRLADAATAPVASGVAALVVKPSGAVAWTACLGTRSGRCVAGRGDELHVEDARGGRVAVVAPHRIAALGLRGSELRFQVAGTPRTLPLA